MLTTQDNEDFLWYSTTCPFSVHQVNCSSFVQFCWEPLVSSVMPTKGSRRITDSQGNRASCEQKAQEGNLK